MPRKITCKNGRTFTYLSPKEKYDKYKMELWAGLKLDHNYKPKVTAGYMPQILSDSQRKYREDYISSYEIFIQKSKSKGSLDFFRDIENHIKYNSLYRNNKN